MKKLFSMILIILLIFSSFTLNVNAFLYNKKLSPAEFVLPMGIGTIEIIEVGYKYEVIQIETSTWHDTYFGYQALHNLDGSFKYDVNIETIQEAIIAVTHNPMYERKTKLLIENLDSKDKYYYNVYSGENSVNYPVQFGDGQYRVKIYENTEGSSYKRVFYTAFTVELEDQLKPFLNSHLEMNWNTEDDAIVLANDLANNLRKEHYRKDKKLASSAVIPLDLYKDYPLTEEELIHTYYTFIIISIIYDYDKINGLSYDYLPDIDETLELKTGICYDYSTLLGSMLRSQGIPTKLIKGYTTITDVYHAWNEIYLQEKEAWIVVDTTFDAYYYQSKQKYDMIKEVEDYQTSKYY